MPELRIDDNKETMTKECPNCHGKMKKKRDSQYVWIWECKCSQTEFGGPIMERKENEQMQEMLDAGHAAWLEIY